MKPDVKSQVILIFSQLLQSNCINNFTFNVATNDKGEVEIQVLEEPAQFGKLLARYTVK